ncbi:MULTISPECIES: SMI1/KNR4 family protein [unclassified Nonomuraea]|uniref:SMI1/KNR4 family protein n=1 Tax=unclassified Nonomuraea TaxID=2593643 RepID=UPI0033CB0AF9
MSAPDSSCHPWSELLGRITQVASSGASEDEIRQLEERLGTRLPPSYRAFLHVADGWGGGTLRASGEVGWVRDLDEHLAAMGSENDKDTMPSASDEDYFVYGDDQDTVFYRPEYLPDMLLIGEFDAGVYLLNPHITPQEGEWEAWYLAPWLPGAQRFRSFWDLMNDEFERFASYYS